MRYKSRCGCYAKALLRTRRGALLRGLHFRILETFSIRFQVAETGRTVFCRPCCVPSLRALPVALRRGSTMDGSFGSRRAPGRRFHRRHGARLPETYYNQKPVTPFLEGESGCLFRAGWYVLLTYRENDIFFGEYISFLRLLLQKFKGFGIPASLRNEIMREYRSVKIQGANLALATYV